MEKQHIYSHFSAVGKNHMGHNCRLASLRPPKFRLGQFPLWRLLGLPVVRAAETDEAATTMDKLAESKPNVVISDADVRSYLATETGRDRLNAMFSQTETNKVHPELTMVVTSMTQCGIMMSLVGWVIGGRMGKERFLEKAKHRKFDTKYMAFRGLNDAMFIGAMKHGTKWGLKTATFVGIFMLVSQSIAVYRNKSSVLEYVAGGAVTGSLFRLNMGLKGFVGGGSVGGTLGLLAGIVVYGLLYVSGERIEERHYWRIHEHLREIKERHLLVFGKVEGAEAKVDVAGDVVADVAGDVAGDVAVNAVVNAA